MGGSQSSRKLTVSNDDPTSVIKVSDGVIKRLKGRVEDDSSRQGIVESSDVNPRIVQGGDYTMTSLQILQAKEAEIRNIDAYWEKRLMNMQENHKVLSRKMDEEYEVAVKEVQSRLKTRPGIRDLPCQDMKANVITCYKTYPRQTLNCAKEVEAFSACVDSKRSLILEEQNCP